jgi:hypothetical protein
VIQQQVPVFDALLRRRSAGALRNPPGFLVAAIKREDLIQHPPQPTRAAAPALRSNVAPHPQQLAPHDLALAQWECSEANREKQLPGRRSGTASHSAAQLRAGIGARADDVGGPLSGRHRGALSQQAATDNNPQIEQLDTSVGIVADATDFLTRQWPFV